jgi:hypothetical protein
MTRATLAMAAGLLVCGSHVTLAESKTVEPEQAYEDNDNDPPPPVSAPCSGDERFQLPRDSRIGIGRIRAGLASCTGFILSNGAFLTAGHCVDSDADGMVDSAFTGGTIEFNVPDSTFDGCIQTDGNTRSYSIDRVIGFQHNTILGGSLPPDDWAVFTVLNDGLGNNPAVVEGFLRPDDDIPGIFSTLRVTGYGNDTHPNNGGNCNGNSDASTLQTDTDILQFKIFNEIGHRVDTEGGDSGAPIIDDNTGRVVGIHNTSLCNVEFTNSGVAFTKNNLADAVNSFQGSNAVHLDHAAPSGGDGTAFQPFDDLADAVNATPSGGTLVIVAGSYSGSITIDTRMDIVLPVGGATLGD